VLPPWCRLAHWWTNSSHVPWREFFDAESLKSSKVPVIEFDEYVRIVGGAEVDLVISWTNTRIPKDERFGRRNGGFYGWAKNLNACEHVDAHTWVKKKKRWKVSYSGECEGGVKTVNYHCGLVSGPRPKDLVDMVVSAAGGNTTSILLKRCDSILVGEDKELDHLRLRESMLFAKPIRQAGEDFIISRIGGARYISAHCRRGDFLRARSTTTPDVNAIGEQLNLVLKERAANHVFIATDAPDDLRIGLEGIVKGRIHFLGDASGILERFEHPGQRAAVEMWVAARSNFFVGTHESRFSLHVQLERGWLGQPRETSEREFCKTITKAPCTAPSYIHTGRVGSQHALRLEL